MSDDGATSPARDAWRDWCDRLKAAGDHLLEDPQFAGGRERAEGLRWLSRLVVYATQQEVEAADPAYPTFVRHQNPHNQWGGPNPDNLYLRAPIDPTLSYRLRGDVTGVRQAIFSLHEGDMHLGEYGVFGECSLDQFEIEPDGTLEVALSGEEQPGNWIALHPQARILTIRVFQSDWIRDAGGSFSIARERGGHGLRPPLDEKTLVHGLERSANWVEKAARYWPRYTRSAAERAEPNVVTAARGAKGGADHILYGSCIWEIDDDEALLLSCEAPDADYWGFTLHTLGTLESGDFADRQTSLNGEQLHLDGDGLVRIVVAHRDPEAPNWIDTEGRRRGMLLFRWVWARTQPVPATERIAISEVRARLPQDHPTVGPDQRRHLLAARRDAAWRRWY